MDDEFLVALSKVEFERQGRFTYDKDTLTDMGFTEQWVSALIVAEGSSDVGGTQSTGESTNGETILHHTLVAAVAKDFEVPQSSLPDIDDGEFERMKSVGKLEVKVINELVSRGLDRSQVRIDAPKSIELVNATLSEDGSEVALEFKIDEFKIEVRAGRAQNGEFAMGWPFISFRIASYPVYWMDGWVYSACAELAEQFLPRARPWGLDPVLGELTASTPFEVFALEDIEEVRSRAARLPVKWIAEGQGAGPPTDLSS